MKLFAKLVAIVVLAASFSQAEAQVYPDQATNSGGALIVSIWDPNQGVSLAYAIPNTLYQDLADGSFSQINFVTVPGFDTVFASSDPADIQYQVYAAGLDSANSDRADIFVTSNGNPGAVQVNNITGTFVNSNTIYTQLDSVCEFDNSCAASAGNPGFLDTATWGDLSAQFNFQAAATVGTALDFYRLSQPTAARVRGTDPATVTEYIAGAVWLLSADGVLSYNPVPVPAAVWLLLSGLFGFGAISRRRQA